MPQNLVIPVYLDTNTVLDLLAILEDGFSTMEKVSTKSTITNASSKDFKADGGTEFGVLNVLNLLKISIGYLSSFKKQDESVNESSLEKYHTYGSLLSRLIDYLEEDDLLSHFDGSEKSWNAINKYDFILINGLIKQNPLLESLTIMSNLTNMAEIFKEPNNKLNQNKGKTKNELDMIKIFVDKLINDINIGNIRKFLITGELEYKYVISIFTDYLRDKTMSEISNKEYKILGKVVRKISKNDEPINLLSGTSIGAMNKDILSKLAENFSQIPNMSLPKVITEIKGPALEIIPIAIFA